MIKRILICILFLTGCQSIYAAPLFNVSASGPAAQISLTLCLNGNGPLSCQNFTVSAITLSITTTIPNRVYPNAGIKINTPGYTPTGCTLNSNGFCLFAASNTTAASIAVTPPCQADVITFTPSVIQVNNPASGSPNPSQQFTINMTMCNSQFQTMTPSASNPIHIDVYGAPNGAISPTSTTSSTGSATFTYSGQSFPNNISINAWISDNTNNGAAIGVTQILKQNTPSSCSYGSTSYQAPLVGTLPNALQVQADVGYDTGSSETTLKTYTIDTGSLGVVVPSSELPSNGNVIGPGAPGVKYYDSSGNTYSGNYYLAPVRVKLASGTVQTQPIMVLGIDNAYCTGPITKSCYSHPPSPDLHYLGVGFNRNSTTTDDLFNSPTANAFLHITNNSNGTDVTPGYVLTPGDSMAATGLTLGITSVTGYNVVSLTPNTNIPGDFNAQAGCYSFPNSPLPNQFCGTALLDVGIDEMFIELPRAQWPTGTHNADDQVPAGIDMAILMGPTSSPIMSYTFTSVLSNPPASSATPAYVQWVDSTLSGQVFVNTGRRPLYLFNYLYDGQCGQVGLQHL